MNVLQRFVMPNLEFEAVEDMYVRLGSSGWVSLADPKVNLPTAGVMSSDTFFNGFSIEPWKRHCKLQDLLLQVHGAGRFVLTLGLHREGRATVWLDECELTLEAGVPSTVPVTAWESLSNGMLFFRLRALQDSVFQGAAFITSGTAPNDVKLGIVITHFKREKQVTSAVARIQRHLLDHPAMQAHLTLTVVDNSQTLDVVPAPRTTIIRNRNLGGTGGFVRGLLALKDESNHTHALFMDDDASCEPEAIARTLALLRYARDGRLAICGALLRSLAPWHVLEKGARFDGRVRPLHGGLDVRRVDHLLLADRSGERPDYGAWWFFAFPIAEARQFPFPFFVRGDDIYFGLRNRFDLITMNGIACIGDDFGAKHGTMTAYLDARYHLVLALMAEAGARRRIGWIATRLFTKPLTSYLYASARAVALAVRQVSQGPAFFEHNLDLQAVRAEVAQWRPSEAMQPLGPQREDLRAPRRSAEGFGRRLARLLTLQGFLLPGFLLKDRTTLQDKDFHGRAAAVFRYRRVLYRDRANGTGCVASFDRGAFFNELIGFCGAWFQLLMKLPALRAAYRDAANSLGSEAFWRRVYDLPEPAQVAAASSPADLAASEPPQRIGRPPVTATRAPETKLASSDASST